jgi:hypothetical protein
MHMRRARHYLVVSNSELQLQNANIFHCLSLLLARTEDFDVGGRMNQPVTASAHKMLIRRAA